jgi:Flp pilus assembly protein TadD
MMVAGMRKGSKAPQSERGLPTIVGRRPWLPSLLLVALTTWTFFPVAQFDFAAYDDYEYIVDNPHVATGVSVTNVQWAFENAYVGTGGPLTWMSHMLDAQLFGLNPGGHHVTNVILHLLTGLLLFTVLRQLTGSVWRSGVVATLFSVHPLHVESVAWIAERKDVLSGFFWFATMAAYLHYVAVPPRLSRYLLVVACFVLGLMSKPMVVTLPFVLLLLDRWPLARVNRSNVSTRVVEKVPLVALALLAIGWTFLQQQSLGAITPDGPTLGARVANALVSIVAYLKATFWPAGLIPYYPLPDSIPMASVIGALVVIGLISWLAVRAAREVPALPFGWLWYLMTLVPVLGLIQVGGHARADRFTYLPLVGIFIALVWGGGNLARRWDVSRRIQVLTTSVVIIAFAITARAQVWHWQDGETLWRHTVQVDPNNARAHANLGAVLARRGRAMEAVRSYEAAIRLDPNVPHPRSNLGMLLEDLGDPAGAVPHYRDAVRLDPAFVAPRARLAVLLAEQGNTVEALQHFREAIRLTPDDPLLHGNLGVTLGRSGRPAEAIPHMAEAMRLDPTNAQWCFIAAMLHLETGDVANARRLFVEAVRLDPDFEAAKRAIVEIDR